MSMLDVMGLLDSNPNVILATIAAACAFLIWRGTR